MVLWSNTSVPGAAPAKIPSLPMVQSRISWSVRTTTSTIVEACATALAEVVVWAPSLRAASVAAGEISKATAVTLADFNRESRALPIAPVPTKPIFSIFSTSLKQIFTHDRGPSDINSVLIKDRFAFLWIVAEMLPGQSKKETPIDSDERSCGRIRAICVLPQARHHVGSKQL